jgi:hypothetical protein
MYWRAASSQASMIDSMAARQVAGRWSGKLPSAFLTISKSIWPYRFDSVCPIESQSILIASSFLRTVVCVADSISLTLPSFSKCRMMIDWMSVVGAVARLRACSSMRSAISCGTLMLKLFLSALLESVWCVVQRSWSSSE